MIAIRSARLILRAVGATLLALLPVGCSDAPRSPPATRPTSSSTAPASQAGELRDWVRFPEVDPAERELAPRPRIASLSPQATELCCAMGLQEFLVARTNWCSYPPGIEELPCVGGTYDLNIERVMGTEPTLVLVSGSAERTRELLARAKLRIESIPDATLDDLFVAAARLGELVGRRRTAEALCRAIKADIVRVTAGSHHRRNRVLFLTEPLSNPPTAPFVAGPGSFYDELLHLAGQQSIVPRHLKPFPQLSLEFMADPLNEPDLIFELDTSATEQLARRGAEHAAWKPLGRLRAVRDSRVYVLGGSRPGLLGPRIAFVLRDIVEALELDKRSVPGTP